MREEAERIRCSRDECEELEQLLGISCGFDTQPGVITRVARGA
jgi:hypothetical protein